MARRSYRAHLEEYQCSDFRSRKTPEQEAIDAARRHAPQGFQMLNIVNPDYHTVYLAEWNRIAAKATV